MDPSRAHCGWAWDCSPGEMVPCENPRQNLSGEGSSIDRVGKKEEADPQDVRRSILRRLGTKAKHDTALPNTQAMTLAVAKARSVGVRCGAGTLFPVNGMAGLPKGSNEDVMMLKQVFSWPLSRCDREFLQGIIRTYRGPKMQQANRDRGSMQHISTSGLSAVATAMPWHSDRGDGLPAQASSSSMCVFTVRFKKPT
ncbi:hypothetical protein LY76DRAFT_635487 [Colletotrichum caudatum]|nr:hypothetical protein LY76DRAFT_635487 [Colletotrichum caudatum]